MSPTPKKKVNLVDIIKEVWFSKLELIFFKVGHLFNVFFIPYFRLFFVFPQLF